MNRKIRLFKTFLKNSEIFSIGSNTKNKIFSILKIVGTLILILFGSFSLGIIVQPSYEYLKPLGLDWVIIRTIFLLASIVTIITAFLFIINAFYFSSDVENQLYLPVEPGDLIISKLAVVTLYEIGSKLLFFIPAMLIYGFASKSPLIFYIKSFIALALIPIVPMAIVGILVMILMRFSGIFKNKERFRTFAMSLAIIFSIGINVLIGKLSTTIEKGSYLPAFLTGEGITGKILTFLFPSTMFLGEGFRYPNKFLINLGITVLLSTLALALFYFVGNKIYIEGALGLQETAARRKKLTSDALKRASAGHLPVITIALNEWKSIFRTPAYLMNGVAGILIIPIFLTYALFTGGDLGNGESIQDLTRELGSNLSNLPITFIIVNGIMFFNSILNLMTSTMISREGKNFQIMKIIPVSYRTQIIGKIIPPYLLITLVNILLVVGTGYLLNLKPIHLVISFLFGLITSYSAMLLSALPDVMFPKLNWDTEIKAMKQNPNFFFVMLIVAAIVASLVFSIKILKLSTESLSLIIIAFVCIIAITLTLTINKIAESRFALKD